MTARRDPSGTAANFCLESLERRAFLSGVAPTSIAGYVFFATVNEGRAPFAREGTFEFRPALTRNTYVVVGTHPNVSSSAGTYAYERTGRSTATVTLFDSIVGGALAQDLVITSATTGTYTIVAGGGFQRGTFRFVAPVVRGSVSGVVFNDVNGNGKRESGDNLLSGQRVYIDKDNDGVFDANEKSRLTDSRGRYRFADLPSGTYRVREVVASGWRTSKPAAGFYRVVITSGVTIEDRNFANTRRTR